MSQIFRTEAAVMKQAAANVDTTNDDIRNELGRLRSVVEQVRGSWDGAAQASFDELMGRWNTAAVKLQESLGSISENLRNNAGAFENVEAQNADALRRTDVAGLQL
ncbi:WXG100 family type VII secretion target [Corynebacterium sp. CCM 9186]|uniref:WXG100 family type VII secretion target n=1 Tax=Corynebacterium meridianum TaxID=2765363 RepID=UPI00200624E2|nr:WXG100 family type VII secretion target [Corynebacterium meridianum]